MCTFQRLPLGSSYTQAQWTNHKHLGGTQYTVHVLIGLHNVGINVIMASVTSESRQVIDTVVESTQRMLLYSLAV